MKLRALTFALAAMTTLATACDSGDEGIYLLRVDNQRAETVRFRYGDISFGNVPGETLTTYVEVEPGPDNVFIDGAMVHEDVELGHNLVGENFWTYTIQDLGHGLSADEPQR